MLIDGITIRDSQVYNIRPILLGEGLRIMDVKIVGNWRHNSDGMHNCYVIRLVCHCFVLPLMIAFV